MEEQSYEISTHTKNITMAKNSKGGIAAKVYNECSDSYLDLQWHLKEFSLLLHKNDIASTVNFLFCVYVKHFVT